MSEGLIGEPSLTQQRLSPGAPGAEFWNSIKDERVRETLIAMLADPEIAGVTDAPSLSYLVRIVNLMKRSRILQFGTWIGFSTLVFAEVVRQLNPEGGMVFSVDPNPRTNEKTMHYLMRAGLQGYALLLTGRSWDDAIVSRLGVPVMRDNVPYDLIYVDSSHAYRETKKEIEIYSQPKWYSPTGVMYFHDAIPEAAAWDPTGEGGVLRALAESLPKAILLSLTPMEHRVSLAVYTPEKPHA